MSTGKTLPIADLPQDDPRVKQLNIKIKKEGFKPDALIEILHNAQNSYGYLPLNVLQYISKVLKLPPSRVFGTVSFYHFFSMKSKGEHTCLVCTGTACYVKGAQKLLDSIENKFSLKQGQVSEDGRLGVQAARCIGACGLAPAVIVDNEVHAKVIADDLIAKLTSKLEAHEQI